MKFERVEQQIQQLIGTIKQVNNHWYMKGDDKRYQLCHSIADVEIITYRTISLLQHLPNQFRLIDCLLSNSQYALVTNNDERITVSHLYKDNVGNFMRPDAKEYILRTINKNPLNTTTYTVNRQYTLISENELRIATIKSKDLL